MKLASILFILGFVFFSTVQPTFAQVRVGIVGDGFSDEYQTDDARGGSFGNRTMNWVEQLVKSGRITVGPEGSRGQPRRNGYEYNWARSGATAKQAVEQGQHTGVVQQLKAGQLDVVVLMVGLQDFTWVGNNGYKTYYDGLTTTEVRNRSNAILNQIDDLMRVLHNNKGNAKIIVVTIPDPIDLPAVAQQFPDEDKRYEVSDVIAEINYVIEEQAYERELEVMFGDDLMYALFDTADENYQVLYVGDKEINFTSGSDDPSHVMLSDNYHFGTVAQGIFANVLADTISYVTEQDVPILSDEEILAFAGLNSEASIPDPTPVPTAVPTSAPTSGVSAQPTASVSLTPCATDVNQDGVSDMSDHLIIMKDFLKPTRSNPRSDINKDNITDVTDYSLFLGQFLKPCTQ